MKIFATSDMHGNLEGLDPSGCELAVIAGDIAPLKGFGKWHWHDQKKWIQDKFMAWIQSYPDTQFVVIPGNHDYALDIEKTSMFPGISWKLSWPENAHLLLDSSIELFGLKIYGTSWVPIISHTWAFEAEHDKLVKKFSNIPFDLDILVSHAPPHVSGSDVDYSLQTNYGPFGSNELTQVIFNKQPKRCFCGHIHSGSHSPAAFDKCTIYNVSRLDENYDIAYEPTVIDVF